MKQFIEAGEFVTTHGVMGELKLYPWCDGPEFVAALPRLVVMTMDDIARQAKKTRDNPNARIGGNNAMELAGTVKTYRYMDEDEAAQSEAAADAAKKEGK